MKFIVRAIGFLIANGVGLYAAGHFIQGFSVTSDPKAFLIAVAVLAGINMFLRPIVKALLTPIIILTLGLFVFVINGAVLYALAYLMPAAVTITGLTPLVYATILTTIINVVVRSIIR